MISTLTREEVAKVIEGKGCAGRVPIIFQKWVGPNIYDNPEHRDRLHRLLGEHPQDLHNNHLMEESSGKTKRARNNLSQGKKYYMRMTNAEI